MKKIENASKRIIFFGTPEFAATSLESIINAGYNVVSVVTSLDNPSRGNQMRFSHVKSCAIKHDIPILQPVSMKSPDFIENLKLLNADIFIVVAFRMMPEIVWNMPPMGTVNLHGSILPKYRGAAPINWAIINGETETGVTTFKLKHEIDTGDILLQKVIDITYEDDAGTLHDKMMYIGAELLIDTIKGLFENILTEIPQNNLETMYASKLFKGNTQIDWNKSVKDLSNFIRGLSPYPCSHFELGKNYVKIFKAHSIEEQHNKPIGISETDNKTYLRYAVIDGWIYIDNLQFEGKKRMFIKDFLNGYKLINNSHLSSS